MKIQICPRITSPPETLKSEGAFSTFRTLTFPSTTYADHLCNNNNVNRQTCCFRHTLKGLHESSRLKLVKLLHSSLGFINFGIGNCWMQNLQLFRHDEALNDIKHDSLTYEIEVRAMQQRDQLLSLNSCGSLHQNHHKTRSAS